MCEFLKGPDGKFPQFAPWFYRRVTQTKIVRAERLANAELSVKEAEGRKKRRRWYMTSFDWTAKDAEGKPSGRQELFNSVTRANDEWYDRECRVAAGGHGSSSSSSSSSSSGSSGSSSSSGSGGGDGGGDHSSLPRAVPTKVLIPVVGSRDHDMLMSEVARGLRQHMSDTLDDMTLLAVHRHNHGVDEKTRRRAAADEDRVERGTVNAFQRARADTRYTAHGLTGSDGLTSDIREKRKVRGRGRSKWGGQTKETPLAEKGALGTFNVA